MTPAKTFTVRTLIDPAVIDPSPRRSWDSVPRSSNSRLYTHLSIFAADLTALSIAGIGAVLIRHVFEGGFQLIDYLPFLTALPVFLVMYAVAGLYPGVAMNPVDEFRKITYATTGAYLIIIAVTFLSKAGAMYSRLIFIGGWICSIILVVVVRNTTRAVLCRRSWWGIPIVVLGAGSTGTRLVEVLRRNRSLGLRPVAILDDDPSKHRAPGVNGEPPVLGPLDLAPRMVNEFGIRYAVVAMPSVPSRELALLLHRYAHDFPYFLLIPDFIGLASVWVTAKDLGGVFGLEIQQNLIRRVPQVLKRVFDLSLVIAGGLALLPLLAAVALAVKLTSRGPVFFGQKRIGRNGGEFRAWKFRSMVQNADEALQQYLDAHPDMAEQWRRNHKLINDPRVTAIGKFLRKTSLDELPQLWNVLIGDMSLVGPRPIVRQELEKYGNAIELYHRVRPGITGLWQVSGRSNTTYDERIRLDEHYVRNWSVWLDIFVLGETVRTVIRAEGAC